MTTPDYRALCAELLDCDDGAIFGTDLAARARALLSAPEAVGVSAVTLEQVDELCAEHGFIYDNSESLIILRGIVCHAIARYGTAHPAPVPTVPPSGQAYRYHDYHGGTVIRFNSGCEVNGSKPIEAVPYWFTPPHPAPVPVAIPAEQWHEDDGPCLWWAFPINEPPYSGSPLDSDWPGCHTHFTRMVCPELPLPEAQP
jgi:hypothetical protein